MEARNITIINSRTQNRVVFSSTAETLADLKADCGTHNIDYAGLTFFEGISKSELKDDAAILPKDLPWKGSRTNDLIFMLTEPQKKIRNGASVTDRKSAYAYIKANNLQDKVQAALGENFTRCKTVDLVAFCNKQTGKSTSKTATKAAKEVKKAVRRLVRKDSKISKKEVVASCEESDNSLSLETLVDLLVKKGYITAEEVLSGTPADTVAAVYTDSDLKDMFRNVE